MLREILNIFKDTEVSYYFLTLFPIFIFKQPRMNDSSVMSII
jgi:hypothetical protein